MIPQLPPQVIREMAQRRHRYRQYLWHRLRGAWPRLTESARGAVGEIDPAWVPPRPALDASRRPARDNDSGEDFLFMHRRLLAFVNELIARLNDPSFVRVEGWRRVPPPGDARYPVPEFPDSELEEVKSAEYFKRVIAGWERLYTNTNYLRRVTLGQLGSDLEFTIRNDMHMRWAAPSPVGYRPPTAVTREIGAEWDAPAYDYLGDSYSSHVNPLFWKIHGWVDERVEDWKRVHGVNGEISWKGTWVGAVALNVHAAADDETDELRRIDAVISASAASAFDGFIRPTPARLRTSGPRSWRGTWP